MRTPALFLVLVACTHAVTTTAPAVENFEGRRAQPLDAARLAKLEAFIEDGQRAAKIPGVAVAVIQNGKVVFEKGFGVKALGQADPVTPRTLFRVASITKPLTSLLIARLVAEGKFSWDTRVTELYPAFALADAELTKKLTVHDLLCACSGIPYDNLGLAFEYSGVSGESMVERMKVLSPNKPFGTTIQESNAMIAAAGYVAAHARNPNKPLLEAYDEAMHEEVFGPLGMVATTFDPEAAARSDHASPHLHENPGFTWELLSATDPAEWASPMNPSIGAWSTVDDLIKVLQMELANGKTPDGTQLFAEKELLARRVPQSAEIHYGLGLYVEKNRGVRVDGTAGHAPGYSSNLFFLPDHGVAGVILTNADPPNPFTWAFEHRLLELLFDGRDEATGELLSELKRQQVSHAVDVAQVDFTPGRAFFERFTGSYESPLYGKITIRPEGDGAVLDAGEWRTTLGRKREADGAETIVGTPPPWLGWPSLTRKEREGKVTLELHEGQRTAVFERK